MYKISRLVALTFVLTGCAGMNTEFEHSVPAKDSGYWLQQADEMTQNGELKTNSSGVFSAANITQYKLIDTGRLRLPVKNIPTSNTTVNSGVQANTSTDGFSDDVNNVDPNLATYTVCSAKQCYPEPSNPFRETDSISRVWIAPHVSPDDNVHLGEIVYFVAKKSKWYGVEKDGK